MANDGGVDRRQFLRAAAVAAVVAMPARSVFQLAARRPFAPTGLTPDEAFSELLAGNRRFAANQLTTIDRDLTTRREQTVEKQEPFAGILACADSRVVVELLFDQSIGSLFVTRVAGNIVTPEIIGSLEYAVAVLGIRALLVLGHSNCGAVKAAMKTEVVPGQISALYSHLRPAIERSAGNITTAIEINAKGQAELLRSSSTVIQKAVAAGTLKVSAGVYSLATGKVALT